MRIHHLTIDLFALRIDLVDHLPPYIDKALVARHQQCVAKTRESQPVRIAVGHSSGLRNLNRKSPAVTATIPLAVTCTADRPIKTDIGRDDSIVVERALPPGLYVVEHPAFVLILSSQSVGINPQRRRHHILRMVADHVGIILEVSQHFLEIALAVQRNKTLLDFVERIAGPVECSGLAQHRPAAAVEETFDDLVLGIVVGRLQFVAHIETSEAPHPTFEFALVGIHQPVQIKRRQPLPVVDPVEHYREFAVIHSIASKGFFGRLSLGVLF